MTTLLQRGQSWHAARLKVAAGVSGVYRQGNRESASLTATVTLQEYDIVQADGSVNSMLVHDWTFTAADIVIEGDAITPRPRDTWEVTINGVLESYEVLPLGNKPCFERADTTGIEIRVHMKKVG